MCACYKTFMNRTQRQLEESTGKKNIEKYELKRMNERIGKKKKFAEAYVLYACFGNAQQMFGSEFFWRANKRVIILYKDF